MSAIQWNPLLSSFLNPIHLVNPALDCFIVQLKDEKPAAPSRGRAAGGGDDDGADDDDDEDEGGGGGAAMEDLIPRVDVGAKFDGALINELADKNWKVSPLRGVRKF